MNQIVFCIKNIICILFFTVMHQLVYSQQKLHINGYVADADGQLIPNATVTLLPDNKVVMTDEKGRFSFAELYEGTYKIRISCVGYKALEKELDLERRSLQQLKLIIEADETSLREVAIEQRIPSVDNLLRAEQAAMPVTVITRRQIELMGSRRLDEVMKEQTGVAVVNDISGGSRAVGVQMQGFSSNYVMVLIDGQPMLGRNNGNFDLSRISVTNIERIEIIKGASSCLYGSDALGGAINIITRHGALAPQANASILYGSLNIVDATLEAEAPFASQRGSVVVSGNYYRTDGFNSNSYMKDGTTLPPYSNYSFQGRTRYRLTKKGTVGFTARYAERHSTMINDWSDDLVNKDNQTDRDLNLAASYDHQFENGFRSMTRYYYTRYETQMDAEWVKQSALISAQKFGQQIHRIEQQFAYSPVSSVKLTGGLGGSLELMDNKELSEERSLNTAFGYIQAEWKTSDKLNTLAGIRYDRTNVYGGKASPSFGLQYNLSTNLLWKAGIGAGFKSPDYKMRYQAFFNPAANYLVLGTDVLKETLQAMENAGELSYKNSYVVNKIANNLQAEKSMSFNTGIVWQPQKRFKAEMSVFYHRIDNQINNVLVGSGTTIGQIYTYRNLPKAVNKGLELTLTTQLLSDLELSAGYQYLIAKDLSVLDSIRSGKWPFNQTINNPVTGESTPVTTKSYWGIEDRSRHMLNLKALYVYRPLDLSFNVRANIRGKYPFQEINGNQFIDKFDAFVPEHVLLNITIEKKLWNDRLSLRVIGDNILNFTHQYMPGQPGRVILGGVGYRWFKE